MNANDLRLQNNVTKKMLKVLIFTMWPLLIFLLISFTDYGFNSIAKLGVFAREFPSIFSSTQDELSAVMGLYVKIAPLFAILFFIRFYGEMNIKKGVTTSSLISSLSAYYLFYALIMYLTVFSTHDIAISGRFLRIFSENEFLMVIFYMALYSSVYVLSVMLLWFSVGVVKSLKERG